MINKFVSLSDIHWGITRKSRYDDIDAILETSMRQILQTVKDENPDMTFVNGDMFHGPNTSIKDINRLIDLFIEYEVDPKKLSVIRGNHCLLKNTFELTEYSSISLFYRSFPEYDNPEISKWDFGKPIESVPKDRRFVQIHQYIDEYNYEKYFDLFPDSEYLLSGDNHTFQIYEKNGRHLINTGHVVRNSKAEKDPYFVLVDNGKINKIPLPDIDPNSFNNIKNKINKILNNDNKKFNEIFETNNDKTYDEYMKEKLAKEEYEQFKMEIN